MRKKLAICFFAALLSAFSAASCQPHADPHKRKNKISRLKKKEDKKSGNLSKTDPKHLIANQAGA